MFEHLWLIMLVILGLVFIAATVRAVKEVYDECEFDSAIEFIDAFADEHEAIAFAWAFIALAGALILFGLSLAAYKSAGG